jgi:hypothetical protein
MLTLPYELEAMILFGEPELLGTRESPLPAKVWVRTA